MGVTLGYKVGTMIEIPRAALVADEVTIAVNGRTSFITSFSTCYTDKQNCVYLVITDCEGSGVLLIWNERPNADDLRLQQG